MNQDNRIRIVFYTPEGDAVMDKMVEPEEFEDMIVDGEKRWFTEGSRKANQGHWERSL